MSEINLKKEATPATPPTNYFSIFVSSTGVFSYVDETGTVYPLVGLIDPMTTAGDLIYRNGSNVTTRLGVGTNGQTLSVVGGLPTWGSAGSGSVTSVSVTSTNGFSGTVSNPTTTPAITIQTTVTGLLKGNGTAISAATSGADYVIPSGSITGTASNITASSNSTLVTLSSLALPYSQLTGTVPTWNQNTTGTASNITASSNSSLTTLSSLALPFSQLTGQATLSQLPSITNQTVLGNVAGITATPTALSTAQLTTLVNNFTSLLSGSVPASGGGTSNFLRADGTWVSPAGGVTSVSNSDGTLTISPTSGAVVASRPAITGDVTISAGSNASVLAATTNATLTTISSLVSVGTITTGTWSATTIAQNKGGTGFTTYTTGDTLYASATNTLSKLGIGTTGQILTVVAGVPAWANAPVSGITSINSDTTAAQTIVTASTGTDFTISTTGGVTTVAIPSASATARGLVTTGTQTIAGNKTFSGTISASNLSGTNTGDQTITLTGDVTGSGTGSFSTTLAATTNSTLTTLSSLVLPVTQLSATAYSLTGKNTTGTGAAINLQSDIKLGTPSITDTGVGIQQTMTVTSYAQQVFQNTSNNAAASTDHVLNNDLGTASTYYANLGINSSTFTGTGSLNLPSASYLTSTSGDLVLGTTTANQVRFVINGGATDALQINTSSQLVVPAFSTAGVITNNSSGVLASSATLPIAQGGTNAATTSQNFAFIGPTSGSGAPSFRAIVAGDIPTLNQNTSGTASNITASSNTSLTSLSNLVTVGTIGTGTWQGTAIGPTYGGTNQTSYTTGDILYASATNTLSKLSIGSSGQVLTVVAGLPNWSNTGTVTSFTNITVNGTAGNGYMAYSVAQSATPATPSAGFIEYANSSGYPTWLNTAGFTFSLSGASLTANRVYTMPDAAGSTLVVDTATQTLTNKTISGGSNTITNINGSNIASGTVANSRGGTGQDTSTAANGTLLIGNGSGLTLATLTGGTGITVTNGSGSISLSVTANTYVARGGDTMTGLLTLSGDPSTALQAATKQYVDALTNGLKWKSACDLATTANITLSGEQTIDGTTTSSSRVLVKNQSTSSQNGIYTSNSGAWTRTSDTNSAASLTSAAAVVSGGSTNAGKAFVETLTITTLGTDPVSFSQFLNTTYTAGNGLSLTGTTFSALMDGSTLSVSGSGIKVASGGITNTEVNASAAIARSKLAAGETFTKAVIEATYALTDAATIAVDATQGNIFTVTLGGNRVLGTPTGAVDGQKFIFRIKQDATGGRTLSMTNYAFGTNLTGITLSTAANAVDVIGVQYSSSASKYYVLAFQPGY